MSLTVIDVAGAAWRARLARVDATGEGGPCGFERLRGSLRTLSGDGRAGVVLAMDAPPYLRAMPEHGGISTYKAGRSDGADREAVLGFLDGLRRDGWPCVSVPGHEADDVCATYAARATEAQPVTVVSGDKDLWQLVGLPFVTVLDLEGEVVTRERVRRRFGVEPEQVGALLALAGDAGDGVDGVPGIGIGKPGKPGRASVLLGAYPTLDAILAETPWTAEAIAAEDKAITAADRRAKAMEGGAPRSAALAYVEERRGLFTLARYVARVHEHLPAVELARRLVTLRSDLDLPAPAFHGAGVIAKGDAFTDGREAAHTPGADQPPPCARCATWQRSGGFGCPDHAGPCPGCHDEGCAHWHTKRTPCADQPPPAEPGPLDDIPPAFAQAMTRANDRDLARPSPVPLETDPMTTEPTYRQPATTPGPRAARAERIRVIFREQAKALAGCFTSDGMTMVTRAMHSAVALAGNMEPKVTAESICTAALQALHLGLEPGVDCYVYPYGSDAKLTVGPQGLIKSAMRSGFVESVSARPVFAGDRFEYDFGTNELHHVKATEERRPWENGRPVAEADLITHAYAIVHMRGGGRTFEVLTREDLGFYQSFSKAKSGPWIDNFGGMARKTAIKRALALVPIDALTAAALRETSEGTVQLPAELDAMIERAMARRDGKAPPAQPAAEVLEQAAAEQAQTQGAA